MGQVLGEAGSLSLLLRFCSQSWQNRIVRQGHLRVQLRGNSLRRSQSVGQVPSLENTHEPTQAKQPSSLPLTLRALHPAIAFLAPPGIWAMQSPLLTCTQAAEHSKAARCLNKVCEHILQVSDDVVWFELGHLLAGIL